METSLTKFLVLLLLQILTISWFCDGVAIKRSIDFIDPANPQYPLNPDTNIYCFYADDDVKKNVLKNGHYFSIDVLLPLGNKSNMIDFMSLPEPYRGAPGTRSEISYRDALEFTHFYLYNNKNGAKSLAGEQLNWNADNLIMNTSWDKYRKTKVLIHGFAENLTTPMPANLKNEYVKNHLLNTLVVTWEKLADKPILQTESAGINTYNIGRVVGEYILFLYMSGLNMLPEIHIIGYDLGAHIAGVAGQFIVDRSGRQIARITGLDPSSKGYEEGTDKVNRLDETDAAFVDVIHTNMGTKLGAKFPIKGLGTSVISGHVDFYPDGGRYQEECETTAEKTKIPVEECSHTKALTYFINSVAQRGKGLYKGCKCSSWADFNAGGCGCPNEAFMGEPCDSSARGARYLTVS